MNTKITFLHASLSFLYQARSVSIN